jgi:hypothetical protein
MYKFVNEKAKVVEFVNSSKEIRRLLPRRKTARRGEGGAKTLILSTLTNIWSLCIK